MTFSFFQKIKNFICKDTGKKNESRKLIVVIRILLLSMLFYIAINSIIYISILNNSGIAIMLASFAIFLLIFILSYRQKTSITLLYLNACTLLWTYVNVSYFGWNTGVQHFIVVLLVLCFFSAYSQYRKKFFYATALCVFRIYLYFHCQDRAAVVTLDSSSNNILQLINTLVIFWCISVIAYIFSKDSQNLESKLVEYNTQLISQANTDALTGLYNRRKAQEYMAEILNPANASCASICICDIDFFKNVNDKYGHDMGDMVLQKISHTMKTFLNGKCFIARWGGEEFLLVFPNSNGDEAHFLLEQLRSKIKALQFDTRQGTFSISMTFGLTEYDFHTDIDSIIKEADEKLYMGKEHGRDQIVF
ncbi:MAG: GGDEF domain-containing protein [Lachnospiraceae bacterium]|nr:GGDEF domain-containing protein [Lachnospiraceae bacterium]